MTINSVADVMAVAKSRGFEITIDKGNPPMPVLLPLNPGVMPLATPVLMAALRAWRTEIIEEVLKR